MFMAPLPALLLVEPQGSKMPTRLRVYLDHCMPSGTVSFLRRAGLNVVHAKDLGLGNRDDSFHFQEAKRQGRVLITNDSRGSSYRVFPMNKHPGLVIIEDLDAYRGLRTFLDRLDQFSKAFGLSPKKFMFENLAIVKAPDDSESFEIFFYRERIALVPGVGEILVAEPPYDDVGSIPLKYSGNRRS